MDMCRLYERYFFISTLFSFSILSDILNARKESLKRLQVKIRDKLNRKSLLFSHRSTKYSRLKILPEALEDDEEVLYHRLPGIQCD